MFVSESKFLEKPSDFIPHILNPNPEKLEGLITKPAVEAALLVRLAKKARWYGAELGSDGEPIRFSEKESRVDVEEVVRLYREYIIPLTKEVEVSSHFSAIPSALLGVALIVTGFTCRLNTSYIVSMDCRKRRSRNSQTANEGEVDELERAKLDTMVDS